MFATAVYTQRPGWFGDAPDGAVARGHVVLTFKGLARDIDARARLRSPNWTLTRQPSFGGGLGRKKFRHATTRLTSGWRYVGPPMPRAQASRLLAG